MNLKAKMLRVGSRVILKTKKNSPELLVAAGVVGFIGTVVLASKATLKMDEVIDNHQETVIKIKEFAETADPQEYTNKDLSKDLFITYTKTSLTVAKSYLPAFTLGVLSVGCFLTAHKVLKNRNLALMMTYKALEGKFANYRKRVVEDYGTDVDHRFNNGIRTREIEIPAYTDENGKKHKAEKVIEEFVDEKLSDYAVVFCEQGYDEDGNLYGSSQWSRAANGNAMFLNYTQEAMNNLLQRRGHVFLNEVYEHLGMPHTAAGAITGWVVGHGDDFIDFGIYELNSEDHVWKESHKKGQSIALDFNVDGIIYDLLSSK